MANKRQLKKAICRSCGQIAGVCLTSQVNNPEDIEKWDELVIDTAMLQVNALKMVCPPFRKKVKEFGNGKAYRKARIDFYKNNVKQITEFFRGEAAKLAQRINELQKS